MIPKLTKVLLVTDFSPTAENALPYAYSIVEPGGTVILVHVIEHQDIPSPLYAHYSRDDLFNPENQKKAIALVTEHLKTSIPKAASEKDVTTEIAGVIHPHVAEGIVAEAKARQVDAIVIGSHGRTGLGHILLGSVAEAVIRHCDIPVLVIPRHKH